MSNRPHILYIEDHFASRQVMSLIVQTVMQYQLTLLDHTNDILGQLKSLGDHSNDGNPFDVIILDLNMKPLNGLEVCSVLRADSRYKDSKIIVLTANATPAQMRQMQACGLNGMLNKPINHTDFPKSLERIIQGEFIWDE